MEKTWDKARDHYRGKKYKDDKGAVSEITPEEIYAECVDLFIDRVTG